MADLLDRLDELYGKATPGEWLKGKSSPQNLLTHVSVKGRGALAKFYNPDSYANANLAVALHNAYPALAARLRAAEADNKALRARVEELEEVMQECVEFGHGAGHGKGYTIANTLERALNQEDKA